MRVTLASPRAGQPVDCWISAPLLAACLAATACAAPPSPATWTEPLTGIQMVLLPAGELVMGSQPDEPGRQEDESAHRARLSRSFYLARHEVTQGEWWRVTGARPSWFASCGDRCPVEWVDWYEVQGFLAELNRLTGRDFRLPTEAEWEYACRAGASTAFATGDDLDADEANVDGRYPLAGSPPSAYRGRPLPVESFLPNAWGLYDLHGNVWEWVEDEHCPYPDAAVTDPRGHCGAELRVIRGGSFEFGVDSARCALRYTHRPQDQGFSLGFRVAHDA